MSGPSSEAAEELLGAPFKLKAGLDNLRTLQESDIEIGPTPKDEVFRLDHVRLFRYGSRAAPGPRIPLLITYALVNRPYMVDLQENRSLVRNLLALGVDVFLIDWGYPGPLERWASLSDYIDEYMDACVDAVRDLTGQPSINLLGICQGGVFSLCYTALYGPKIRNLITMVAPVDFHVAPRPETGLLNAWIRGLDVDQMVDAFGNIPGDLMNFGYLMLRPFQLNLGKYLSLFDIAEDRTKLLDFLRMEKWIFDSPDQPGEVFREFIKEFYQNNSLVRGSLRLNERPVSLKAIVQPVLNIYAEQDHLVPPESSQALGSYLGTQDYTVRGFQTGHIGMYVSGKVQKDLPAFMGQWLRERDQ